MTHKILESLQSFERLNGYLEGKRQVLVEHGIWVCPFATSFVIEPLYVAFRISRAQDIIDALHPCNLEWKIPIPSEIREEITLQAVRHFGARLQQKEGEIEAATARLQKMRQSGELQAASRTS